MPADGRREDRYQALYERARAARLQARATAEQIRVTRKEFQAQRQRIRDARVRAEQVRALWAADDDRERLRYSPYARLQARLASMPVIEQAKGIIMAECGWSEGQAFNALRQASQRSNIRVRDLAAQIVATTAERSRTMAQAATGQNAAVIPESTITVRHLPARPARRPATRGTAPSGPLRASSGQG